MHLRNCLITLIVGISLVFSTYTYAAEQVLLTLRDAIYVGLRYNPNVQSGEIQRIVDKYALRVAFWNYELHYGLTGTANYTRSVSAGKKSESDNQALVPTASILTPVGTQVAVGMNNPLSHTTGQARNYNPSITFGITQPLLQGSGTAVVLAPLHQAEDQELINRLNLKNTVMTTITTIITQYAALAQAQNSITAQRLTLQQAVATLKQQEAMLKTGRIAASDLVQLKATISSQQLLLEQQEVTAEQQKQALLATLGIEPTTPIVATKKIAFENDILPTLKEAICLGLAYNISYQQALINVKLSKINLLLAEDQQRWQLNATATHVRGGGSGGGPNSGFTSLTNGANYSTTAGLTLTVPIDNLQLVQTLAQAKVALQQQLIALAAQKRQVVNDVVNAYYTVINQKQQIVQAKSALDLAQQSLDIADAKLKYGRSSSFEVSTLQNNLLTQELSYINTISAYWTTLAALDQILGTTLDRWNVKLKY